MSGLTLDDLKEKAARLEAEENGLEYESENDDPVLPEGEPDPAVAELNTSDDEDPEPAPEDPEPVPEDENADPIDPVRPEDEVPEEGEFAFEKTVKVMDKEHEIPDFLAKSITNEEQYKEAKEMVERFHGLDAVKEKRDFFKAKSVEAQTALDQTNQNLDFLDSLLEKGDMQTFQKAVKITDELVLKRAAEIIQYRELTPQQKAEYDNNVQSKQRLYALEHQNNDLRQSQEAEQISKSETELNSVISNENYQPVAAQFDAVHGYGAFRNEVIQRAANAQQRSNGKEIWTPQQAVEETVKVLGFQSSQTQAPQTPEQQVPTNQSPETKVIVRNKPTIPKIGGGSKSPVKKVPKSIDDLRRMADEMDD